MQNTSPLGKGLSALLTTTYEELPDAKKGTESDSVYKIVDINSIEENPYQPRNNAKDDLKGLIESIKENGVLSPLLVNKKKNGKYSLIAGERRFQAGILAGLKKVPIIVMEAAEREMLEIAIIENIQRKDLNPIEEATAYLNLKENFKLSTAQISKKLGITVEMINKRLALLRTPDYVQKAIITGDITASHAEQLYPLLSDLNALKTAFNICIKNQLSFKQLRALVDKLAAGLSNERAKKIKDERTREMEIAFTKLIGRKIYFNRTHKGGKIIISFNNDKELDDLYQRFSYIGYHV